MAFSSAGFLFAFLPVMLVLNSALRSTRARNALLVAGSLVFYAFGSVAALPVLLASAAAQYAAGLLIGRYRNARRWIAGAAISLDLCLLAAVKYADSLLGTVSLLSFLSRQPGGPPVLPGVSFFTFQAISYIADVCREPERRGRSFLRVLEYLTFFPVLLSGPLTRFSDVSRQFECREVTADRSAAGIRRFALGLAKKLLLAGAASTAADAVFALGNAELDVRTAWLGALAYTLQIYFDFSGYSDMAIGLGAMFGFSVPENFRAPFCASSVTDFWRRWHMTLSGWFRDYVYIPLGGNRKGRLRTVLNKLAVFLLTGLWHGASWTFLLWGLWHGVLVSAETLIPASRLRGRWYGRAGAMLAVVLGFVMFRSGSVAQGLAMLRAMAAGFRLTGAGTLLLTHLPYRDLALLALGAVCAAEPFGALKKKLAAAPAAGPIGMVLTLALLIVCAAVIASGSFQPFIYSQF